MICMLRFSTFGFHAFMPARVLPSCVAFSSGLSLASSLESLDLLTYNVFLLFSGLLVVCLTLFLVDGVGSFLTFTNPSNFLCATGISTYGFL